MKRRKTAPSRETIDLQKANGFVPKLVSSCHSLTNLTPGKGLGREVSRFLPGQMDRNDTRPDAWLVGGGEMGKVVRAMDWSKTPLGPIESWPQSLRTTVSLCLASNFPIALAWGPQHGQIYNDGYWPICGGKHPPTTG